MALNFDISTDGLERVDQPVPRIGPPLDLVPPKSPFYRGPFPTTAVVNPDAVRNFSTPGIPSYRITPAQPLNIAGASVNTTAAATATIVPRQPVPAPTISQSLTSIPTGYQFSFLQVRLPMGSTTSISSYKVYRNTSNTTASATVIQSIPHHQANVGVPVVVQDAQPNGSTVFYFVSAVNISGIESTLTPAQAQGITVSNNAGFDSNSRLAGTFHNNPVNTTWSPRDSVTLSNNSTIFDIAIAANTSQFAPGQVHYNSGTVSPPSFGTWVIFADDPQFQGGAAIYNFTSQLQNMPAAEGRLLLGKIATSLSGASTGGGTTGGTGGSSFAGGRGLIQI